MQERDGRGVEEVVRWFFLLLPSLVPLGSFGVGLLTTGYVRSVSVSVSVVGHPSIFVCLSVYTRNYTDTSGPAYITYAPPRSLTYLRKRKKKKARKAFSVPSLQLSSPYEPLSFFLSLFVFPFVLCLSWAPIPSIPSISILFAPSI